MKTNISILAFFALLVSSSADAQRDNRARKRLGPVLRPGSNPSDLTNIVPQKHVVLNYGANSNSPASSLVNVTLSMKYPTVLLEEISSVANVDCTNSSVAVTFSSQVAYERSIADWSADGGFVMVTNHLGDCDAELERGMFLVQSVSWDATAQIVTASASKESITTSAETGEFTFGVQAASPIAQRDLILDPTYTLPYNTSLTPDTVLYKYAPYLTVTADDLQLTSAVTFSGYLRYNFLLFKLEDLYFDIDVALAADLEITAAVTAAYSTTFGYTPASLTYALIDIPGVLELGPALTFAAGADLAASAAVDVTAGVGIIISDGNVHLDALDKSKTTTSGWVPTYSAFANISGVAEASIDPYISLTVEIAVSVLGGLVDLSTGITAKPKIENDFILTGSGGVSLAGVTDVTSTGTCAQGLELKSGFVFTIVAFATQWYSTELYKYQKSFLDECFSWA